MTTQTQTSSPDPITSRFKVRLSYLLISWMLLGYPIVGILASSVVSDSRILTVPHYALILVMAFLLLFESLLTRTTRGLNKWLALFFFMYFCRLIFDSLVEQNSALYALTGFYVFTLVIPVCVVGLCLDDSFDENKLAKYLLVLASIFLLLYFFSVSRADFTSGRNPLNVRIGFEALNPISMGHAAATSFLVGLYVATTPRSFRMRLVAMLVMIGSLIVITASASRGPMVALAVALLWFAMSRLSRFIVFLPFAALGLVFVPTSNFAVRRFQDFLLTGGLDKSAWQRLSLLKDALEDFIRYPVLGRHVVDLGNDPVTYPHNIPIETAMSMGMVGVIVLIIIFMKVGLRVLGGVNQRAMLIVLLLIQYFIGAQVSGNIARSVNFFLMMTIVLSLGAIIRERRRAL